MSEFAALHHQLLRFQRRMRALRVHTPSQFDAITSNLLPVIANRSRFYSRDLCGYLRMNPTQVSRLLERLEKQGFISRVRETEDARFKALELSLQGRSALSEIVALDNRLGQAGLAGLNDDQKDAVVAGLAAIADGFGAPREEPLIGEDLFVTEQKRAARVLGMLGNDYLESGLDIATYQLCYALFTAGSKIRFRDLRKQLPFDGSYLSREIDRLVHRGWLRKSGSAEDARALYVAFSPVGGREFSAIHTAATARIRTALAQQSVSFIERFTRLLDTASSYSVATPVSKLEVRRCRKDDDFYLARASLIEWLVATDNHRTLSAELLPKTSRCYLVSKDGAPLAIAELKSGTKNQSELEQFETSPHFPLATEVLEEVLQKLSHLDDCAELFVSPRISRRHDKLLRMTSGITLKGKGLYYRATES